MISSTRAFTSRGTGLLTHASRAEHGDRKPLLIVPDAAASISTAQHHDLEATN